MEQTLLPVRVLNSNYFLRNKLINPLTSNDFTVMNTIVIKKEVDNVNRKQKLNQGNKAHGPLPQTELFLRSGGRLGREAPLQTGGWPGIQESLSGRHGHHRAFMRWLEILESADRTNCSCRNRGQRTASRTNVGTCSQCCQERSQENRRISGTESEGCAGRPDSLVLPGLRQELHCLGRRSAGDMPQPPSQLKRLEKGISINWQAPFIGSLPCFVLQMVTIPPLSAEVTNGDTKVMCFY